MRHVDLNCDLGESFGAFIIGADAELMSTISSANVACGFHAGDPAVMRRTVRMAREAGVAVGAHPGLPDLVGFGRRDMRVTAQEVEDMVLYQVGALRAIASAEGVALRHVKAHGALYNMAARDRGLAEAIARAVRAVDPALILFGLAGSEMLRGGKRRRPPDRGRRLCRPHLRAGRVADPARTGSRALAGPGVGRSTRGADGQPGLGRHDRRV